MLNSLYIFLKSYPKIAVVLGILLFLVPLLFYKPSISSTFLNFIRDNTTNELRSTLEAVKSEKESYRIVAEDLQFKYIKLEQERAALKSERNAATSKISELNKQLEALKNKQNQPREIPNDKSELAKILTSMGYTANIFNCQ